MCTILQEVADKEKAWFEREAAANEDALRRTRALLPVGVTGLTVAQLEQRAIEAGSLYPRDLALRLKVHISGAKEGARHTSKKTCIYRVFGESGCFHANEPRGFRGEQLGLAHFLYCSKLTHCHPD